MCFFLSKILLTIYSIPNNIKNDFRIKSLPLKSKIFLLAKKITFIQRKILHEAPRRNELTLTEGRIVSYTSYKIIHNSK